MNMAALRLNSQKKYRAIVAGRAIDLEFGDEEILVNGVEHSVTFSRLSKSRIALIIDGRSLAGIAYQTRAGNYVVHVDGGEFEVTIKDEKDMLLERFGFVATAESSLQQIRAPMPGLVLSLRVEEGQEVKAGDGLVVLEAMKMENELRAEADGIVKSIHVERGDAVGKNDLLVEIEA